MDSETMLRNQFETLFTDKLAEIEPELQTANKTLKSLQQATSEFKCLQAKRFEQENLSLRVQGTLYEVNKAEFDKLKEKLKADLISTRMLQEQFNTYLSDQLPQLKSQMQRATNELNRMCGMLSNFRDRLNIAEQTIKQCCAIENIASRMVDIQKELVEMESKGNDIVDVYGNHLGVYSLVFSVGSLMLQKHIECTWSPWGCVGLVLAFIILLVLQVGFSYSKILNIGRTRWSLIKQLSDLQQEGFTLAVVPDSSSSPVNSTFQQTIPFARRVLNRVSKSYLEESPLRFSRVFLGQLIIPAICLIIIFGGMMYSVYQDCDEAPGHGLQYYSVM